MIVTCEPGDHTYKKSCKYNNDDILKRPSAEFLDSRYLSVQSANLFSELAGRVLNFHNRGLDIIFSFM